MHSSENRVLYFCLCAYYTGISFREVGKYSKMSVYNILTMGILFITLHYFRGCKCWILSKVLVQQLDFIILEFKLPDLTSLSMRFFSLYHTSRLANSLPFIDLVAITNFKTSTSIVNFCLFEYSSLYWHLLPGNKNKNK